MILARPACIRPNRRVPDRKGWAMQPRKQIAIFGSFLTNARSVEYQMAEDLGYLLARYGCGVTCGGHGGIVDPLVAGTVRGGGMVAGISLAESAYPKRSARMNPLITEIVKVNSMPERLQLFAESDGFIFFTGGIGTLSEFAFVWHSLQLQADFNRPIVVVSRAWQRLLAEIRHEQMIKHKYYRLIHICERPEDAVAVVTGDYSLKYDDPVRILSKEAVFFELDGTIVESPEEEFIKSCEDIGCFFRMPDVVAAFRNGATRRRTPDDDGSYLVGILEHLGIDTKSASEIAVYVQQRCKPVPELYGDVPEILHHLKENGFSTGIVTKRHPRQLAEILAAHNLAGLFDFTGILDRSAGKPITGLYGEVLTGYGFCKDGIVHVGGNFQEDYLDPRAAGVDSILLDRHLSHIFNNGALIIRSLKELKCLVRHRHSRSADPLKKTSTYGQL